MQERTRMFFRWRQGRIPVQQARRLRYDEGQRNGRVANLADDFTKGELRP